MKCEVCGAELSAEALEANSCLKCGAIIDIDAPFKDASEYKRKAEFVDSIQNLMNTNLTVNRSQEIQKQENLKKVNDAFEYHAEIILDLIEKVITKLARNKKEDMSKGLDIRTIKSKNLVSLLIYKSYNKLTSGQRITRPVVYPTSRKAGTCEIQVATVKSG